MRTRSPRRAVESFADHVRRVSVDADVLANLVSRIEIGVSFDHPGFRIGVWILDDDCNFEVTYIHAVHAFSDVELLRMRMAGGVEPRLVVEAHRVDDQRISLPMADRVSHPIRIRIRGMAAPIQKDLTMAGSVVLEEHDEEGGSVNELIGEERAGVGQSARETACAWRVFG